MRYIEYATKYRTSFKKLTGLIQQEARRKEKIFLASPFDARLKTHKLHGALQGYWSYSVNFRHRVVFRLIDEDVVFFFDVGTHAIYQ